MKLPKVDNLSPAPLLPLLAVAVLVTVPLRTFQLLNCVDPKTGFWAAKDFTVPVLYFICIAIAVTALIITLFGAIMPKPSFTTEKNILSGCAAAVFAVTLLTDMIFRFSKLLELTSRFTVGSARSLFGFLASSGAISIIFEILFGICAEVYIIRFAVSAFKGKDCYSSHRILALSPAVWTVFRLIYHFVDPVNFRNVSQLLLEIAMLCFTMVFFLSFARIASDINRENSMWLLWFTGISAALLAFITSLPLLVLVLTGKGSMIPANYPLRYSDLGIAVFISTFLFTVIPLTNETGERR